MNPVETIYASFPFFLYINPDYAGQLLSPLLEFQDSVRYDQVYAARDLGQPWLPLPSGYLGDLMPFYLTRGQLPIRYWTPWLPFPVIRRSVLLFLS